MQCYNHFEFFLGGATRLIFMRVRNPEIALKKIPSNVKRQQWLERLTIVYGVKAFYDSAAELWGAGWYGEENLKPRPE